MIEIIPAMDLIDGKCVRLTRGDFERKTIYSDEPLDIAKGFEAAGITRLHMVDLDGAKSGSPKNMSVLEHVAKHTSLDIDFGGGIKSDADLESVFSAGAAMANIGSLATTDSDTFLSWVKRHGGDRILLGADAKDGNVAINGWQTVTAIEVTEFVSRHARLGVTSIFVTDISRDGAMGGPAIELYEQIISLVPDLNLIASGGVRSMIDVEELERIGCAGVIVGKAVYEGRITMKELSNYAR